MRRFVCLVLLLLTAAGAVAADEMPRVLFEDNRLYVDGEPFYPYGCWGPIESVESMKQHHMTCVFSGMSAAPDLLEDAAEHDFMVITYPYAPRWGEKHEEHVLAVRDHPNLLAWNIGDDLKGEDAESAQHAFEFIRENDPHNRPIMLDVIQGFEQYTWFDEMFNTYHYPLLKPETMLDYIDRFHREHAIVGADRYLWTWAQGHVQIWYTQRYLDPDVKWMPSLYPDGTNLRMVAYTAMAAGCRGILYFPSRYFTEEYHGTDRYAEAAVVGCELEVIGPWLAQGEVGEELATSHPTLHAWPVDFPGGTLVLAICIKDDAQYHVDEARVEGATITLPRPLGDNERVYALSLDGGARDITDDLAGVSCPVPDFDITSLLLITGDRDLASEADAKLASLLPDGARYATQAASAKADKVTQVLAALRASGYPGADELHQSLSSAREEIETAGDCVERADWTEAFGHARVGDRTLRGAIYDHWRRMNDNAFVEDAELLPNFYLAERYYPRVKEIIRAEAGENLLVNPSFERTEDETVVGWQDMAAGHNQTGARGLVEEARTGDYALRFTSESPTIYQGEERDWVTVNAMSDPIEIRQWDGLEATAWVRIDEDLRKTERGAVVQMAGYDAEGEALGGWKVTDVEAGRVEATDGWMKLTARHVVTQPNAATVAIRLGICGVGEVRFDDVSLVRLRPGE